VQSNLDDTVESIDAKNDEIDQLQQYVDESAPFAVQGTLPDTTVLVVAEEGVDAGPVEDLVRRTRLAGAHADGIVWIGPRWELAEVTDRQELSAALELDGGSAVTVRAAAWSTVVAAMAEVTGATVPGGGAATTTLDPTTSLETTTSTETSTTSGATTVDPTTTDGLDGTAPADPVDTFATPALVALDDAGFVRMQRVDGEGPESGANVAIVFVTGPASEFGSPASLLPELSRLSSEQGIPTVVAEAFAVTDEDEEPTRGSTLEPWRDGDPVGVSTVDDLDLLAGRVAAVLALADLRGGVVGHYGYGPGADRVLPEWLGP
jgi:hypothetical protein